jgi:phospholipid/cholesterol/gamma-HCH transport system substrate-binding protein
MPRTRSLAWAELKVGVVTVAAVVITAVTIFTLTGSRGFFWQRYHLKTRFDNVAGLTKGAPVRVSGVEVGQVTDLTFVGEKVDVVLEVNKEQQARITTGSLAKVGSVSLLGQGSVDITASTQGSSIPDWGYVPAGRTAAALSDVTDQASQGVQELTGLIHDIRTGRGTMGKLMTDDQLFVEMRGFVGSANDVVRSIQQGDGTIGRLLRNPEAARSLETSLANLQLLTQRINSGEGSLGKLLSDDTFARSLADTTVNLKDLTNRLSHGEGTAGKLMTDTSLFNRLNAVSLQFDQLMNRLNEGQGTAGQLLKDKRLYENMNGAVNDLRTLLANIQSDPRKYLNVKVSVF